jgi:hypothetical protein
MRRTIAMLVAAGLLTMPVAAHALGETVWLMLHGGAGTYGMSDLNAEIDAFNTANAGTGWSFDHIDNGHLFGGSIGFETLRQWNLGLGWDRLDAKTRAGDDTGAMEYRFSANAWRVFGEYALRPIGQSTIFLGGAVGIIQESGKFIVSQTGMAPAEYKLTGSDPLYEGYVGGSWWATPRVALTTTVGYRYAKVKEIKLEDNVFIMSNGEPMSLDFSGPSVRVGIKLAAGPSGL